MLRSDSVQRIDYGVGDRCQLTVSTPFVIAHEQGTRVRRAFDGMEIGVKYRFVDNPGRRESNGQSDGWERGIGAALLLDPYAFLAEWHTSMREAPFNLLG